MEVKKSTGELIEAIKATAHEIAQCYRYDDEIGIIAALGLLDKLRLEVIARRRSVLLETKT